MFLKLESRKSRQFSNLAWETVEQRIRKSGTFWRAAACREELISEKRVSANPANQDAQNNREYHSCLPRRGEGILALLISRHSLSPRETNHSGIRSLITRYLGTHTNRARSHCEWNIAGRNVRGAHTHSSDKTRHS